jgi:hypothetical protein
MRFKRRTHGGGYAGQMDCNYWYIPSQIILAKNEGSIYRAITLLPNKENK